MKAEIRPLLDPDEVDDVASHFFKTVHNADIIGIDEAIHDLRSEKYQCHMSFLKNSDVAPNEHRLYHGTAPSNIPKIHIQGFNRNFAGINGVLFGRGVYFARDASYSVRYCPVGDGGLKKLCVCDVLVGEFSLGSANQPAPARRSRSPATEELCDSTVDNIRSPSIFVCYHDDQVCIVPL